MLRNLATRCAVARTCRNSAWLQFASCRPFVRPFSTTSTGVSRYRDTGGNSLRTLSQLDLVFVIDSTNSMKPFIKKAGEVAIEVLGGLSRQSGADLRCGVIAYRDYQSFVSKKKEPDLLRFDPDKPEPAVAVGPGGALVVAGDSDNSSEKQKAPTLIETLAVIQNTISQPSQQMSTARKVASSVGALVSWAGSRMDEDARSGVVEVHPLSDDLLAAQHYLRNLRAYASGNFDIPEAVFAGLESALKLNWRPRVARAVVLVGDAPPHGMGVADDRWPARDPNGHTLSSIAQLYCEHNTPIFSLALLPTASPGHDEHTKEAFQQLATRTDGTYNDAQDPNAAMRVVKEVGQRVFANLEFERNVWSATTEDPEASPEDIARKLRSTPDRVRSTLARLQRRNILMLDSGTASSSAQPRKPVVDAPTSPSAVSNHPGFARPYSTSTSTTSKPSEPTQKPNGNSKPSDVIYL